MSRDWFLEAYNEAVRQAGEKGLRLEDARTAVAWEYRRARNDGELPDDLADLHYLGTVLFDHHVQRERTRRKTSFRRDIDNILSVLGKGGQLAAFFLDRAYPVGDGFDKSLGFWAVSDWLAAVNERHENAAAVAVAAREFEDAAGAVVSAMRSRRARLLREVFDA